MNQIFYIKWTSVNKDDEGFIMEEMAHNFKKTFDHDFDAHLWLQENQKDLRSNAIYSIIEGLIK